jgi:hypothetical protein
VATSRAGAVNRIATAITSRLDEGPMSTISVDARTTMISGQHCSPGYGGVTLGGTVGRPAHA